MKLKDGGKQNYTGMYLQQWINILEFLHFLPPLKFITQIYTFANLSRFLLLFFITLPNSLFQRTNCCTKWLTQCKWYIYTRFIPFFQATSWRCSVKKWFAGMCQFKSRCCSSSRSNWCPKLFSKNDCFYRTLSSLW